MLCDTYIGGVERCCWLITRLTLLFCAFFPSRKPVRFKDNAIHTDYAWHRCFSWALPCLWSKCHHGPLHCHKTPSAALTPLHCSSTICRFKLQGFKFFSSLPFVWINLHSSFINNNNLKKGPSVLSVPVFN